MTLTIEKILTLAEIDENLMEIVSNMAKQLKTMMYFECLFGINRLYSIQINKNQYYLIRMYNILVTSLVCYYVVFDDENSSTTHNVFKYTATLELCLLVCNPIFLDQYSFYMSGQCICKIDLILNIQNELWLNKKFIRLNIIWTSIIVIYSLLEIIVMELFVNEIVSSTRIFLYVPIIAHDCELIFFCSLLGMISERIKILKSHIEKVFFYAISTDNQDSAIDQSFQHLSNNTTLDITKMHRVYEYLYECSEKFSSLISFPVSF